MQEKLPPEDPNRENLEFIVEDVNRCALIVKNLLSYARAADQRPTLFGMNALVEQSLALIRDQSTFRNVHLEKEFSPEDAVVCADLNQMSQVIINLVINAIEAMGGSGRITIRTYADRQSATGCIEVADTGGGIAPANISRIFDPFFTTKPSGKNTGLGLSTAYGIVTKNRGKIAVKSTSPAGTTFILEFPLVEHGSGEPDCAWTH